MLSAQEYADIERGFLDWLYHHRISRSTDLPAFDLQGDSGWTAWAQPHIQAKRLRHSKRAVFKRSYNSQRCNYKVTRVGLAYWQPTMLVMLLKGEMDD